MITASNKPDIADGQVRVEMNPDRNGNRWFLVSIGRARYVKRFNLSASEARILLEQLEPYLTGEM